MSGTHFGARLDDPELVWDSRIESADQARTSSPCRRRRISDGARLNGWTGCNIELAGGADWLVKMNLLCLIDQVLNSTDYR